MLDNAYNIVWLNPMAEAHWDISRKQDRMQTITYLIRYPEFIEYLNARKFGEPLKLKLSRSDAGGAPKELVFTVQLVPFGDEQMLLLSRDITEYERLETMRRDFVANVSHELRTPITVMSGFLETLSTVTANDSGNPALIEKSLEHMSAQALRMQRLVEDLLTLSRLEDGRHQLADAPVNMPELVRSLVKDAEQLSNGNHTFTVSAADDWLIGNRDELTSAFSNLVTNAVRYTPSRRNHQRDLGNRRRYPGISRCRQWRRYRTGTYPAPDRALLPRRPGPLASHRRHRPWPGNRETRADPARRPA